MTLPIQREGQGNYLVPENGDLLVVETVGGGGGFGDGANSWLQTPPGAGATVEGGAGVHGNLSDSYPFEGSERTSRFSQRNSRIAALVAPRTAPSSFGTAGNPGVLERPFDVGAGNSVEYGISQITRPGYGYYRRRLWAVTPGTTIPWGVGAGGAAGDDTITFDDGEMVTRRRSTEGQTGAIKISLVPASTLRITGARHTEPLQELNLVAEVTTPAVADKWIKGYEYVWTVSDERLGSLSSKTSRNPIWSSLAGGTADITVTVTVLYSNNPGLPAIGRRTLTASTQLTIGGEPPPVIAPDVAVAINGGILVGLPTTMELTQGGGIWDRAEYEWSVEPSNVGTFNTVLAREVIFTPSDSVADGTIAHFTCKATFAGDGTRASSISSVTRTARSSAAKVFTRFPSDPPPEILALYNIVHEGVWEEVPAPGTRIEIDPDTMPLVMEAHGEMAWHPHVVEWQDRLAGDSTTSPGPSFIQGDSLNPTENSDLNPIRIQDIQSFQNRLVFLTPDSIVCSAAGIPTLWWGATARGVLPSDPIDLFLGNQTPAEGLWKFGDTMFAVTSTEEFAVRATTQSGWQPGNIRVDKAGEVVKDVTLGVHTMSGVVVVRNADNLPALLGSTTQGLTATDIAARTPDLLVEGPDVFDMATLSAVRTTALTNGNELYLGQQALDRFAWSVHDFLNPANDPEEVPVTPEGLEEVDPEEIEEPDPRSPIQAITGFGDDLLILFTVHDSLCIERLYCGHQTINRVSKLMTAKGEDKDKMCWNSYPALDHAMLVVPSEAKGMLEFDNIKALDPRNGIELNKDPSSSNRILIGVPNDPLLEVTPVFWWVDPNNPLAGAQAPTQFTIQRIELRHADTPAFDAEVILRGSNRPQFKQEYRTPTIGYTPAKQDCKKDAPGLPVDDGWFSVNTATNADELRLEITGGVNTGWKISTLAWHGNVKTEGRSV